LNHRKKGVVKQKKKRCLKGQKTTAPKREHQHQKMNGGGDQEHPEEGKDRREGKQKTTTGRKMSNFSLNRQSYQSKRHCGLNVGGGASGGPRRKMLCGVNDVSNEKPTR